MKTIRKISKSPVLIITLLISFLLFSCGKETLLLDNNIEMSGKEMMKGIFFIDGPASYYVTPMSDLKLEQLFSQNTDQLKNVRENIDQLLDHIENKYPGTFDAFKKDMTSGDHIKISEALTAYASIVHQATQDIFSEYHLFHSATQEMSKPLAKLIDSYFPDEKKANLSPHEVKEIISSKDFNTEVSNYFNELNQKINDAGRTEEQMALIVWFAAVVIVVIYVAAVLAYVYAYAWKGYDWGPLPENRQGKSLLKEKIIDAIALNFSKFKL
jgi:SdpC family antimicrobial peptide